MARDIFQIELRSETLKQGDFPGRLSIIILVLKSRKGLFKEMREKKSQERFKGSEGLGPPFLDSKEKKRFMSQGMRKLGKLSAEALVSSETRTWVL